MSGSSVIVAVNVHMPKRRHLPAPADAVSSSPAPPPAKTPSRRLVPTRVFGSGLVVAGHAVPAGVALVHAGVVGPVEADRLRTVRHVLAEVPAGCVGGRPSR